MEIHLPLCRRFPLEKICQAHSYLSDILQNVSLLLGQVWFLLKNKGALQNRENIVGLPSFSHLDLTLSKENSGRRRQAFNSCIMQCMTTSLGALWQPVRISLRGQYMCLVSYCIANYGPWPPSHNHSSSIDLLSNNTSPPHVSTLPFNCFTIADITL